VLVDSLDHLFKVAANRLITEGSLVYLIQIRVGLFFFEFFANVGDYSLNVFFRVLLIELLEMVNHVVHEVALVVLLFHLGETVTYIVGVFHHHKVRILRFRLCHLCQPL